MSRSSASACSTRPMTTRRSSATVRRSSCTPIAPTRDSPGVRAWRARRSAGSAWRSACSASIRTKPSAAPAPAVMRCSRRRRTGRRTVGVTASSKIPTGTRSPWAYRSERLALVMLEEGRVVSRTQVGDLGTLLAIRSPEIAAQAHAGQFVHVRPGVGWDPLLRRPYSFCGIDRRAGEIELIVKPLGTGGEWIAERRAGDALDLLGPLGTSFVVRRDTRNLLLVAGGTGIAPMRVIAEQEAPRRNVTLVMGGRSVAYLWPSDRLPAGVEYVTTTDDGSFGTRGRVTDVLPALLPWADQLLACGPWPMLAALGRLRDAADRAAATYPGRRTLLEAQIAVEQHMGCAMGVCRACVVVTSEGNARVCREGPVFALGDIAFEAGEPATVGVH